MAGDSEHFPPRYARPRRIAVGGMGEIYLAEDETLGRRVAIKLLAERFARDEGVRRRFTREALAAARLSGHPHIVTIFDVGEADERPFIVMEYLPGGTLAERARAGRVSPEEALRWLGEAADALDDAHRNGIVHRDVKPANMLLDERGSVHVGDFGIARVVDETASGMTVAGTVLGTAGYLSPEQARGEPVTPASDVYGLGVVAYELLTGGRPFEGGSATAEAAAHIHEPVPLASERGVGLSRRVDAVFDRVLDKDPGERYETAPAFVTALADALGAGAARETRILPAPVPSPGRARRGGAAGAAGPARPTRRQRPWLPLAAALALAAAAIAGVVVAATMADDDDPGETQARQTRSQVRTQRVTTTLPGTTVVTTVATTAPVPPAPTPTPPPAPTPSPSPPPASGSLSIAEARELTDEATGLMRAGDYDRALPLAQRALARLNGTGETYEGYANYNVGKSLAELGRCEEALPHLERREALLGPHPDVTAAKRQCGA